MDPREHSADRRHRDDGQQQDGAAEDRLTSLPYDILFSILSLLTIKQCVSLSALCSHFRRRLPSLIPRLDTFRLEVGPPSGRDDDNPQKFTFPHALIRQCRIILHDLGTDFPKHLETLLVEELIEAGVQDLILDTVFLNLRDHYCCLFGIKSLKSLSLHNSILMSRHCRRGLPSSPGCILLTSLRMEHCVYSHRCLLTLLANCPFLETLQLFDCYMDCTNKLSIHSASIKHLILVQIHKLSYTIPIDVRAPQLESLIVDVVTKLHIEAPKVRNASFLLALDLPVDPSGVLKKLFGSAFPNGVARLMLNSSTTPNIFVAENGIDRFISRQHKEKAMIFNLDFNLKDQSSTVILTDLLQNCNECNTEFDIRVDLMHIQSTDKHNHLLRCSSTGIELIKLRLRMPEKTFEVFLSNEKKMTQELKEMGLEILRSRTSRGQLKDILASHESSLVEVSSTIANCIEMKL